MRIGSMTRLTVWLRAGRGRPLVLVPVIPLLIWGGVTALVAGCSQFRMATFRVNASNGLAVPIEVTYSPDHREPWSRGVIEPLDNREDFIRLKVRRDVFGPAFASITVEARTVTDPALKSRVKFLHISELEPNSVRFDSLDFRGLRR